MKLVVTEIVEGTILGVLSFLSIKKNIAVTIIASDDSAAQSFGEVCLTRTSPFLYGFFIQVTTAPAAMGEVIPR